MENYVGILSISLGHISFELEDENVVVFVYFWEEENLGDVFSSCSPLTKDI